jgi:glycogen debranching enzyme
MNSHSFHKLSETAKASISANIVSTEEGPYLAAGGHQFGSLWTRDFCFAVRGLLTIGRDDVVRHHLTHLIKTRRADDFVIARVLESVPSFRRVLVHTALRFLPDFFKRFPMRAPLKAEHLGEHGTISIDSNALVLRAVADLQRKAPDSKWLEEMRESLQQVLDFCLVQTDQGRRLVEQGRFEDWQDSAAREGQTLYVNAIFATAFKAAHELGLKVPSDALSFQNLLRPTFYLKDSGVYRAHEKLDMVSLDGNLLLITEGLLPNQEEAKILFEKMKAHPLWSCADIPGVASYPDYPKDWISWTTKAVGLRHYHDRLLWAWLSGLAIKAAMCVGDRREAARIASQLEKMVTRDSAVGEVYSPVSGLPLFRTLLYVSEAPFSWASGVILEALSSM